ncbi:alpha-L-fucosidase [Streptomyces sp. NPDC053474]|uniref:alpha-L-fucosidase n=1 Tax=Streptomyces sp. NPDC053474 TaxID=3365704 RepID=UPI0037D28BED
MAEHHDGFAMYASALNPWNAVAMGPQRDVVGELAAAVRARSMVFGLSTHRAEHWWFLNGGMGFDSDVRAGRHADLYGPAQPQELPPSPQYLEDWLARTAELVERYQPQLLYFDWWIHQPAFKPYLPKPAASYYNKAASWQADTAVSRTSWGHVEGHDYKSGTDLLAFLVDVVSKNGCLLLNVGPKADGSIPEAEAELLREIGAWLAVNGEAIYASRPWVVYGEGPARVKEGQFTENDQPGYGPADPRFTTRDEHLYVTALGGTQDGRIHVRSLGQDLTLYNQRIGAVRLLGHPDPLEFERGPQHLTVRLPESTPTPAMPVLKVSPGE